MSSTRKVNLGFNKVLQSHMGCYHVEHYYSRKKGVMPFIERHHFKICPLPLQLVHINRERLQVHTKKQDYKKIRGRIKLDHGLNLVVSRGP